MRSYFPLLELFSITLMVCVWCGFVVHEFARIFNSINLGVYNIFFIFDLVMVMKIVNLVSCQDWD